MQKGIVRSCAFFVLTILYVHAGVFAVAAQESTPAPTREGITATFASIVEKVAPSVVTVFTTQTVARGLTSFPFGDDTLRQFFGGQSPQRQGKQTLQGLGSGVIVSPDGFILTANHVVSGAEEVMETDAAINMGNSGGALVDTAGHLLGINTAIFSRSGGNQGVGFAIPANLARDVMQSLREKGRVVRGYIGASVQTLTPELAEAMKLKGEPSGALVGEVTPKSPSEKAGMKTGDVITSVNGKKIGDARELRLMIGSMPPGTKIQIEVNREGQSKIINVELAEMPAGAAEQDTEASPEENAQPEKATVFGGVAVADVTDEIRNALNLSKDIKGAVIAEIDADSPAAKAGLREGDVIQEVNKQPVKNAKDLVAISKKLKADEKILIRVWSQGRSSFVALEPK